MKEWDFKGLWLCKVFREITSSRRHRIWTSAFDDIWWDLSWLRLSNRSLSKELSSLTSITWLPKPLTKDSTFSCQRVKHIKSQYGKLQNGWKSKATELAFCKKHTIPKGHNDSADPKINFSMLSFVGRSNMDKF